VQPTVIVCLVWYAHACVWTALLPKMTTISTALSMQVLQEVPAATQMRPLIPLCLWPLARPHFRRAICVLGVDFMSENVRAILDEAGYAHVGVYRMASAAIGCSLAEAAESEHYLDYLAQAGATPNSLHVVYINTSLRTKALANAALPTITCTSSNVVQTVLQAFHQVRANDH
jgi:Quinolinate synthetase A protein